MADIVALWLPVLVTAGFFGWLWPAA